MQFLKELLVSSFYCLNRSFPGIISVKWDNFRSKYRVENGLFVTNVKGDGYCFPKSVLKYLFLDHKYAMSYARLKRKITEHLIANFHKYTDYHTDSPDQLVYEATEFFNDRNFTSDVVDVLIHYS